MSTVLRLMREAVEGLRSFAYAGEGERPRVGLALGGGFARGIAHLGVLRALSDAQIPIDYIAGTSVGALIAAGYASGCSVEEMERQGSATRFRDFGRWTISRMGMASNERLEDFLRKFTLLRRFEEMQIPLGIVATDLMSGESMHFTKGDICPALRASCAYPGLFLPVEHEGRILVDGFLSEAVPAVCVRQMGADIVISVHLDPGPLAARPRNTIEVISRSFSIMQSAVHQPWREATDVLIEPNVNNVLWDEFVRTPVLVAAGAAATKTALREIHAVLESHRRRDHRPASVAFPNPLPTSADGNGLHAHTTAASPARNPDRPPPPERTREFGSPRHPPTPDELTR
ncbi:MAG TPA: patatin-like phospholipase family protein [Candidatus Cybelea sp.]|nr:patatin-like phospholipase family protein [Candidatus Cybelea sp.]